MEFGRSFLCRRILALVFAALAMALSSAPARAQNGLSNPPLDLCVKRGVKGDVARQLFAATARFDCRTRQTSFGPGDFWVIAPVLPKWSSPSMPAAVRTSATTQDRSILYGRYADGVIIALPMAKHEISRHLQLGAIVEQVLPARATPLVQLLWKIEGSGNPRGIVVGAQITEPGESATLNLFMAALYSAFGGLCVALILHNLAMWRALRHPFQLIYCLMVASLAVYALSSSGALAWIWPDLPDLVRVKINYLMLGISASLALLFARAYFEPEVCAGWLSPAIMLVCGVLIASAVMFALLVPWQAFMLQRIFVMSFIGVVALVPPILWRAWTTRSRYFWVVTIAWAAPIIFAGLRVANGLNFINWSFWVDNSTIMAMTSEALLSSFAISYRVRLLSRERDDARVRELAARALADTDPLTGLLNRRSFLARAIGQTGDHVLLIADLDHFKAVNETIGHDGGDEVLRVFARALRASIPAEGLVARIGGEEFAVLLPANRAIDAATILDRLRAERMPFDLTVTASIGASTGPLATDIDWKKLYRRADRALFAAKSEGRDRVRYDLAIAA
ncbi:MAG: hypothetical protein B7Y49_08090 [Sphingomonas sp. 28-62-11]|nr:MAG: hypothetical protein B7Y49_08090 [Sphingomonas sp. 28-62-11]